MSTSWSINDRTMGVTALCIANAAGMLQAFNPPVFTIRTFAAGNGGGADAKTVHLGMLLGGGLSLVVGAGGAMVAGSWWPLIGTIIGLVVILAAQEWALRNPVKGGSNG